MFRAQSTKQSLRATNPLMNSYVSKFYIWNVAAAGKGEGKFMCIPEKNISGECKPKQLPAAFRKESRHQRTSPENLI